MGRALAPPKSPLGGREEDRVANEGRTFRGAVIFFLSYEACLKPTRSVSFFSGSDLQGSDSRLCRQCWDGGRIGEGAGSEQRSESRASEVYLFLHYLHGKGSGTKLTGNYKDLKKKKRSYTKNISSFSLSMP